MSLTSVEKTGALSVLLSILWMCIPLATPGLAQQLVACGEFSKTPLAAPMPRNESHSIERLARIFVEERQRPPNVLFLGDSLTERWTPEIWQQQIAPLGAVNAGIDGDRTEHLLWRIENGHLTQPPPRLIVLLIGTNDLGHGRPPDVAAEGVRRDLIRLRELVPETRILLLGLTPRTDRFGALADAVNPYIKSCAGGPVSYADIGVSLRDPNGRIRSDVIADGVHFTAMGYRLVTQELRRHIDPLMAK